MTGEGPDARIADFRAALVAEPEDKVVVQQYVLHGACVAVPEASHFRLKQAVSKEFDIEVATDVFVVGSAKLGFSIAPRKRWRGFGEHSDIDIAIVNHDLYQTVWHEVDAYRQSGADWPRQAEFERYLAWGWIRPDKLPRSALFPFSNRWWEFFSSLQGERLAGPHKVAAGLYHDIEFLVAYQMQAVNSCRNDGVWSCRLALQTSGFDFC
jgi:hypothetical protein